jgi:hypothetical protein
MAQSHAAIASPASPTRVLFARISWMKYYAGPQLGDERPKGGGATPKIASAIKYSTFIPFILLAIHIE